MKTRRIVPPVVVASLAVAAAFVTGNLIQAAEAAAKGPGLGGVAMLAPTSAGLSCVAGGPGFASAFPPFGRTLDFADRAGGVFLPVDYALIVAINAAAELPKTTEREPRAIDPDNEIETKPGNAQAAAEVPRNEPELDGLFDVVPRPRPVRLAAAKDAQGEKGKQVYLKICYACHQPDGQGVPGVFPMLAQSDFMAADRSRAIRIVLHGLSGPIVVNGQMTNSVMPALGAELVDDEIADVLTYVFNAWENPGGAFTADQVKAVRSENR